MRTLMLGMPIQLLGRGWVGFWLSVLNKKNSPKTEAERDGEAQQQSDTQTKKNKL